MVIGAEIIPRKHDVFALPLTGFVTLGKSVDFPFHHFLSLANLCENKMIGIGTLH